MALDSRNLNEHRSN